MNSLMLQPHMRRVQRDPPRVGLNPASLSESLRSVVYMSRWKKAGILIHFLKRKKKIRRNKLLPVCLFAVSPSP